MFNFIKETKNNIHNYVCFFIFFLSKHLKESEKHISFINCNDNYHRTTFLSEK